MLRIEIDSSRARKKLTQIHGNFKLRKKFMLTQAKPIIQRELLLNFLREGRPAAGRMKWAPLAPRTQKNREKLGFPPAKPILIREGDVFRAATNPKITWEGDGIVVKPNTDDKELLIRMTALHRGYPKSTVDAYGRIVGGAKSTDPPARPFFFVTKKAVTEILSMLANFIVGRRTPI